MNRRAPARNGRALVVSFAIVCLSPGTGMSSQGPSGRTKTLNVVVRDQKGALVTDLEAGDFSIVDAGTPQPVTSFKPPSSLPGEQKLAVLVFGGLSNEGRRYAREAADEFLNSLPSSGAAAAVFVVDRSLYAQESFTSKTKELKDAVKLATSGTFEKYRKKSESIQKDLQESEEKLSQTDQITLGCLEQASQMQREDGTYAALDSLTILAEGLSKVAGRKSIIFFSEGLVIQDVMFTRFNLLVSSALSSQTAIYTVDARGLLTSGVAEGTRDMLGGAREASSSQFGSTSATEAWQAQSLETAGQSVRMNVQEALANLASMTGASILANTNDSRPGMRAIAEEMNQYYQVSYAPALKDDGALHEIVVSVARPDSRVLSPKAYLDLPDVGGEPITGYELPLLELLGADELTNQFDIKMRALRFGQSDQGTQHTLAISVPMKSFSFATDEAAGLYHVNFSLLALVKDASGEPVQKISQDYPLQGPVDKMASMQVGNVLLLRNLYLKPGSYVLEGAARDNGNGTMSALRQDLEIPAGGDGPALSSVLVIDRVDPISDPSKERDNPLRYQNMKIAPNMGIPVVSDPQSQIGFYCVLYPSKTIKEAPILALLFFRDGQPLFKGQPPLPPADAEGRHQVVLNLPLSNFQPGNYEVVAVVQQGQGVAEERASFTVVGN